MKGKKGVYSLMWILEDMCKHSDLFTRASMLEAEGLTYESDRTLNYRVGNGKPTVLPAALLWPDIRHEDIDLLTDSKPNNRKPTDVIPKSKFEILIRRVRDASNEIRDYATKYLAHASTPESRALLNYEPLLNVGLLWTAHEELCRTAACLATEFLGDGFSMPLAVPQYDVMEHIDMPLVGTHQVEVLREVWRKFADECGRWNYCKDPAVSQPEESIGLPD